MMIAAISKNYDEPDLLQRAAASGKKGSRRL
jgi:hypothetical protein